MIDDATINTVLNTGLAVVIALYLLKFITDRVFQFLSDRILTRIEEITRAQEVIVQTQKEITDELKIIAETQKEIIIQLSKYNRSGGKH